MAESDSKSPEDVRPDIGPDRRSDVAPRGGGEGKGTPRGNSRAVPANDLQAAEQSGGPGGPNEETPDGGQDDQIPYNEDGDKGQRGPLRRRQNQNRDWLGKFKRRKRMAAAAVVISGGIVSIIIFLVSSAFGFTNFMKNIEQRGFLRYQVDLNGRSTAWIQTYMELRFGEIDDPNLAPKDRDNIFFRADRVSTNRPLTDWYRTLRASKFEQDVFEKQGIRFTSMAYKEGGIIKYRAGIISFQNTDQRITFDPGQKTFDAIARGDPNAFNGALRDYVKVEKEFNTDKEARAEIKAIVSQNSPNWWKAVKRYHLRKDIQNMIGVRSWRFFETTRGKLHEKKISIRNKIISAALPDDSKSGAFIKCLFGVPDCQASTDPANPKASELPPDGAQKEGDKTNGDPNNPQTLGDGSGEASISAASDSATSTAGAASAGQAVSKIASQLISKASILSLLDSLARFDQALHDHTLTKVIRQAKAAQVAGIYTVFSVASDQLTTGQVTPDEVNSFMKQFSNPTNSQGWTQVVDPGSGTGGASADSPTLTPAKNEKQFCSQKHQFQMDEPINRQTAENEFQYLCPQDRVGGSDQAQVIESGWNDGPGFLLHPFLAAYHAATGGIFNVFNAITGAITGPIENGVLSVLGLQSDVKQVASYAADQALSYGGANININDNTPSGQVGNDAIQGVGVLNEAAMRFQGAATTTTQTAALANKNTLAYQADQEHTSFTNRYLAISNPNSLLARGLFAVSTFRLSSLGTDISSVFADAVSDPLKALTQPAHAAAPDGYAASNFAGIETFDFPSQCFNSNPLSMTPQDATNAVALGIFKPDEVNWDMLSNSDTFYSALYAKVGDNEDLAKKVWDCALLDNAARGGIGALYGAPGEDAYASN